MGDLKELQTYLACPRCDKTPLAFDDGCFRCEACKTGFPDIDGIPWLFAEPDASLGEWRNRLQFALQQLGHETAGLDVELKDKDLRALTCQRLERYRKSVEQHRRALQKLLRPVDVQSQSGSFESYLALRTRLPVDQGLNTYYSNIHRDWAWGDEENEASLKQVSSVLHDDAGLGDVLVLGAGTQEPLLGSVQRFITPHCDPTVNLYDYYWVCRDGLATELWPITARGCSW